MTTSLESIREYYGRTLKSSADLKTGACCPTDSLSPSLRRLIERVHPQVREKFYGCGSPIPPALDGLTVLDLGCGSGRDAYVLAQLVGPRGRVIGIDMTPEQLAVAREQENYQAREFGYGAPNTRFLSGYIEDLAGCGIADESVDVVVSNCVINLSPDKARVFAEIFRVLKPGGELLFADIFADRRIPAALAADPVLRGECLGGALYTEDFRRLLLSLGCADYRVLARGRFPLRDETIESKAGGIGFTSLTVRAFKLALEDRCEDYGQVAYYQGNLPGEPHAFQLDDHHRFETGRPVPVCRNTAAMLTVTRFAPYFRVTGDAETHYGLFDCGPVSRAPAGDVGACC